LESRRRSLRGAKRHPLETFRVDRKLKEATWNSQAEGEEIVTRLSGGKHHQREEKEIMHSACKGWLSWANHKVMKNLSMS